MSSAAPPASVQLEMPLARGWEPVARLVLGGIGDHLDLGYEDLDDLQLAVERLLAEAGSDGEVSLSFELAPGSVRTLIGPLREFPLAQALQAPAPPPGELGLRRVLETVVDSFGVEEIVGEGLVVRLEKVVGR